MATPTPETQASAPSAPKGPPPEAIERTVAWVSSRFSDHYRANPPPMPPRFGRREFGFIPAPRPPPDRTPFFRHMGMRSRDDLQRYLVQRGPWHSYYSTAYYKTPSAATMKEKEWLGADLIFDLDADHLSEEAKTWPIERQLAEVKRETEKLLHEFVLGDLGFDADHVHVVFSGGRGYHIHVDDPRVLELDSAARREIVDYVVMNGLNVEGLAVEKTMSARRGFQGRVDRETYVQFPLPTDPGWPGRYSRAILTLLEDMESLPDAKALLRYTKSKGITGIGEATAESLLAWVKGRDAAGRGPIQIFREEGKVSHKTLLKMTKNEGLQVVGLNDEKGEADEPVTADIKRLIRLPHSLHGKTGLRVTPITIDHFKDFDPWTEAVAFGTEPVKVIVSKPEPIPFAKDLDVKPGMQDLPMNAAMFLILRRRALVA